MWFLSVPRHSERQLRELKVQEPRDALIYSFPFYFSSNLSVQISFDAFCKNSAGTFPADCKNKTTRNERGVRHLHKRQIFQKSNRYNSRKSQESTKART